MSDKEKLEHKKITLAISAASLVPLSAAALQQSAQFNEQADDQSDASKELDGSKSYIEEEKKSQKQSEAISDSVYANRVREENRAREKAQSASQSSQEHSAKEVLLAGMDFKPEAADQMDATSLETDQVSTVHLNEAPGDQSTVVLDANSASNTFSEQPAFFQAAPEERELPIYSRENTAFQASQTLIASQPSETESEAEPVAEESEQTIQIDEAAESRIPAQEQAFAAAAADAGQSAEIDLNNQPVENAASLETAADLDSAPAEESAEPGIPDIEVKAFINEMVSDSDGLSEEADVLPAQSNETIEIDSPIEVMDPAENLSLTEQDFLDGTAFDSSADILEQPASEPDFDDSQDSLDVFDAIDSLNSMDTVEYETEVVDTSLNDRIAQAALGLVGITNGQQCTEVVTEALVQAGVDASLGWPADYLSYGTIVEDPVAGNLVYYDNGGQGLDHIAVYVGDGQAVHGNFTTESGSVETVIYDVQYQPEVNPIYIQVEA